MSQLDLSRKLWDPFKEMGFASRAMDRAFDDFYLPRMMKDVGRKEFSPTVDVHETKTAYEMKFDLPGVPRDQIKIDVYDNTLTVSGERKEEKKEEGKDKKAHVTELFYGSFTRTFSLPEAVDAEKAEARFENGVLNLTLPKKETSGKRQIKIQ